MPRARSWIEFGSPVRAEAVRGVNSAAYTLTEGAKQRAIDQKKFEQFRKRTGLETFAWRAYWRRGAIVAAGGRAEFARKPKVVVVFMHGWDGSGAIWENLPAELCAAESDALVLVPDVNGFGRSPFREPENLDFGDCDPAANMRALEEWLRLLRILGGRRRVPVVFVGHSMSGAALFYLNARAWGQQRVGRCALAPALLMNDTLHKGFYRAMGLGIWAGKQLQLDRLTESLSRSVVAQLISGASKAVQSEHERIFKQTAKSTLATTFFAMGRAKRPVNSRKWDHFTVLLGHEDRLVGLNPMLDLLVELGFNSRQMRVVLGDHYFFSVGRRSRRLHQVSRAIVMEEIQALVGRCRR